MLIGMPMTGSPTTLPMTGTLFSRLFMIGSATPFNSIWPSCNRISPCIATFSTGLATRARSIDTRSAASEASISRLEKAKPSRAESTSAFGRRALTSSISSTRDSALTPPMRPSRARSFPLPVDDAISDDGEPLDENSALTSIVPETLNLPFERHGAAMASGRSIAVARPFNCSAPLLAVKVSGTAMPQMRASVTSAVTLLSPRSTDATNGSIR